MKLLSGFLKWSTGQWNILWYLQRGMQQSSILFASWTTWSVLVYGKYLQCSSDESFTEPEHCNMNIDRWFQMEEMIRSCTLSFQLFEIEIMWTVMVKIKKHHNSELVYPSEL